MDDGSIERFALGFLAVKLSFFAGFLIVQAYQSGRLLSLCIRLCVGLFFYYVREEISA